MKLQPVFALLATLGKPNGKYRTELQEGGLAFPSKTGVREATLLLVKEKSGRFTLIRVSIPLSLLSHIVPISIHRYLNEVGKYIYIYYLQILTTMSAGFA